MLIMISSSCNQDEEIRPEWPFKFVVVNDGSKELATVNLHSSIYYPIEDSTNLQGTIKSIFKPNNDENKLNEFDSVKIFPRKKVYQGCVASMNIRATTLLNGSEVSFFFNKLDTLITPNDSIFVVHWPRDSTLFSKE